MFILNRIKGFDLMQKVRPAAVAGMFYPADASVLKQDIDDYLADAKELSQKRPKAIVVPHAGYIYSAAIAASAFKSIIPFKHNIKRVVLLGPSHRVPFSGMAVPESDVFNTPLGNIAIDQEGVNQLLALPQVIASDRAHSEEHSLEVQLPFLQEILGEFSLIPLVVGDAERHDVAAVINHFINDDGTLIVISSDLSHYHSYEDAKTQDRATSDAIVNLKPDLITYDDACGRNGVKGMMTVAAEIGLHVELLDLRNSGDTAGDKQRVVGYGAYAFY